MGGDRPVRELRHRTLRHTFLVAAAVAGAGSLLLAGCDGDTLFDPVDQPTGAPTVSVVSPTSGTQVGQGQRVPLELEATDPDGVSSIVVTLSGAASGTIILDFSPPLSSVQADTAFVVPAGASGTVRVSVAATDAQGNQGQAPDVTLSVSETDSFRPATALTVQAPSRVELTDEIGVTVTADDGPAGSGVVETGFTAIVRNTARTDTLVVSDSETFPAQDGAVSRTFGFSPPHVDELSLPDTLFISFFGFAFDAEGNCGGAVEPGLTNETGCATTGIAGSNATVANAPATSLEIVVVIGRTSPLPGGGVAADVAVDVQRSRAYVSNLGRNRVHTLAAASGSWTAETFVGSQPWGLALNADGDSLIVANSGGTSMSFVSLAGTPSEDLARRLVTLNTPLFEVQRQVDPVTNLVKLSGSFIDYSDRPQFIAEDAQGKLLYSTRPTEAAGAGTVRVVTDQPGWDFPEAKILLLSEDIRPDTSVVAIAHVDSVQLFSVSGGNDLVEIFDHRPGFPDILVRSGVQEIDDAVTTLAADPNSDILWGNGSWQRERLALEDTTFVASSGDREWIAFGANIGPITMWDASAERIHSRLLVADLVNNASERVTGIDLNVDGSFGAARGQLGSYYWNTDLRLLGSVGSELDGGAVGRGVALYPDHPSTVGPVASSEETIGFVGQGDNTIRILDTIHFTERGALHIRDNLVGPLRAGPPLPTDNDGAGASCGGMDCVVVKLYGITDGGGVVVIDVLRRDIGALQ